MKVIKLVAYSLFVSILAYIMAMVLLAVFYIEQTGWSRIGSGIFLFLLHGLTLALSEYEWWGGFYTIAGLVPWLGSTLVLTLLLYWFDGGVNRRRLLGGLSISVYYFAVWLTLVIEELVRYGGGIQGDIGWLGYLMFLIWPAAGFILGYLSVVIVEKVLKPEFAESGGGDSG